MTTTFFSQLVVASGLITGYTKSSPDLATDVTGILPVALGGSGTATPSLVAGANVTISGSWPNQTISSTGGGGGSGTVTSITATAPLTGGTITTSGSIGHATSGVSAGTYNNVTVDTYGHVTSGSNVGYLTGNQTITLGGDVAGSGATSITATVEGIQGHPVSTTAPADGQVLAWSQTAGEYMPVTPSAGGGPQIIQSKSASYTAQAGDLASLIAFSGGSYTLTLGSQAAGWWIDTTQRTVGQSLQVSAGNTINGSGALSMLANQLMRIVSLGSGDYVATPISTAPPGTVMLGSASGMYAGVAPMAAGYVLTDNGTGNAPTMQAPVTRNYVQAVLATLYTTTTTMANVGLSITLPSAGTYLLLYTCRTFINQNNNNVLFQLWDTTAGALVPSSNRLAFTTGPSAGGSGIGTSAFVFYQVSGSSVINFQAQSTTAGAQINQVGTFLAAARLA